MRLPHRVMALQPCHRVTCSNQLMYAHNTHMHLIHKYLQSWSYSGLQPFKQMYVRTYIRSAYASYLFVHDMWPPIFQRSRGGTKGAVISPCSFPVQYLTWLKETPIP
ncbi:uncharacterized protein CIMG_08342 [Coccidioides immitis RS]|uniref:Uncharacterized protein n=2 Tax=Coccidioides immitis TaxID=5501 RepID=J3K5A6_COCIM|nr:uncharacterized protein CIMG_08342 [Coccidioides immitis RS]EAS29596.3 hypothetical protein CIMG_08342 [Coccidioides immitis RS]KMP06672.1 hypothetical protein CIRG_06353 [Coccidioides immitis RMSCC 2394]